jgi:hypothetical protein
MGSVCLKAWLIKCPKHKSIVAIKCPKYKTIVAVKCPKHKNIKKY